MAASDEGLHLVFDSSLSHFVGGSVGVGGGVVLSGFEAEGEGVLAGGDKVATEVIEGGHEFGDFPASAVPDQFDDPSVLADVVEFEELIFFPVGL